MFRLQTLSREKGFLSKSFYPNQSCSAFPNNFCHKNNFLSLSVCLPKLWLPSPKRIMAEEEEEKKENFHLPLT